MTVVRRERSACLGSSVTVAVESVAVQQLWLLIASSRVTPRVACQPGRALPPAVCEARGCYLCLFMALLSFSPSMTASDQHQPASSLATPTAATVGRFFRASNVRQR